MRKRYVFLAILAVFYLAISLPIVVPIQSASQKQVNVENNNARASKATLSEVFGNNAMIAGLSLIPYFGWGFIVLTLYNTGLVAASYPNPWLVIFLNPFMYIELLVYASMTLLSFSMATSLKKHDFRGTWIFAKTGLSLMVVVLFISATLEIIFIGRW